MTESLELLRDRMSTHALYENNLWKMAEYAFTRGFALGRGWNPQDALHMDARATDTPEDLAALALAFRIQLQEALEEKQEAHDGQPE